MSQLLEFEGTWEELALHEAEFRGRKLLLKILPEVEESNAQMQDTSQGEMEADANSQDTEAAYPPAPSARELLKLPLKERDRILAAQAALLAEEYRTNPDLNCFEAFGPNDLYDEYPEMEDAGK